MNPKSLLLAIAILAILNSCTKDTITPISQEPLPGSVIEFFIEEEASNLPEINSNGRTVIPTASSVEQDCRSTVPSVIVPKMHNGTLEFIYAKNSNYTGSTFGRIKTLNWVVNGEVQLNLSTTLELPYEIGETFNIELTVTFVDGSTHEADFSFTASPDLLTLTDGTIRYDTGNSSFSGATVSKSCVDEFSRAIGIVIIDINF